MLSHLRSHPLTKTSPTFRTASVITASAVPMKMTMLPSHRTNAAAYAVHPPAK